MWVASAALILTGLADAVLPLLPGTVLVWVGVLFMPLVGAALGEYLAQRSQQRTAKVAFATWLGLMVGMVAKVVLSFVMLGIFLVALGV